jgi:hypothetical protein
VEEAAVVLARVAAEVAECRDHPRPLVLLLLAPHRPRARHRPPGPAPRIWAAAVPTFKPRRSIDRPPGPRLLHNSHAQAAEVVELVWAADSAVVGMAME